MATARLSARRPEMVLAILLSGCLVLLSLQVRTRSGRPLGETWLLEAASPGIWLIAQVRTGASNVSDWFQTRTALVKEKRSLTRRVAELESELLRLRDADSDRTRLLELFGAHGTPPPGTHAARLIALETSGLRSALLDRGSSDGLQPGGVVVSPAGLLGRVVSVSPGAARVQLLSDRTAAVGVLLPRSGRAAVAQGDGAGGVNVQYVPIPAAPEVTADDVVVTSGTDGVYPKDLVVGRVAVVKRSSHSLSLEIPVTLSADPHRESVVFVLPPVLGPGPKPSEKPSGAGA